MKTLFIFLFVVFLFIVSIGACSNKDDIPRNPDKPLSEDKPVLKTGPDDDFLKENQAIIDAGGNMSVTFGRDYQQWHPGTADIELAETLLKKCYDRERSGTVNPFFGRALDDYNRQFVGAVNSNGEKVIWINCFCKKPEGSFKDWKTNIVGVDGGGNCFFSVKVNLDKLDYSQLMVNGPI